MTIIVILLTWSASIGFLATASRMIWSFARDRGLPFNRFICKVRLLPHETRSVFRQGAPSRIS